MKRAIFLILLFFLIGSLSCSQAKRNHQPTKNISETQYDLIDWMTSYYKHPSPDVFPNWLEKMSSKGLLSNEKKQFPFLGFAATVFEANADKIPDWLSIIDSLPKRDQKTVLIALWLSNTKESEKALLDNSRKSQFQTHNYFNFQTQQHPPDLNTIDKYWGFLDIQWGRFLASGTKEPIENITSILELASFLGSKKKYPNPKTKEEKWARINEVLYTSAMRSLRSNCKMHPKVLQICEQIYDEEKFGRLVQWSLKSILIEMNPEKYALQQPTGTEKRWVAQ